MPNPVKFRPYRELLTQEQIAALDEPARRLYSSIFNAMEYLGKESVSMVNAAAIARSKMHPSELEEAQRQLVSAGLMDVQVMSSVSARYKFIDNQTD